MQNYCDLKKLKYSSIVVKVGTNVLADKKGNLKKTAIQNIVDQLAFLKYHGIRVVLISSGAVGAGKRVFTDHGQIQNRMVARQVLASIGQVRVIDTYSKLFAKKNLVCSQILVTKEDFRDRQHFLNLRNCLQAGLDNQIIPIVNENDTVSINTVTFTDNDELAGLVAAMLNAEAVMILTSVDGLFTGDPDNPNSELITQIDPDSIIWKKYITPTKTSLGRGGMETKCKVAAKNAELGIGTYFLNGKRESIITDILQNRSDRYTYFAPSKKISNKKKWLASSQGFEKGVIVIDQGAAQALLDSNAEAKSLLPVGIKQIKGNFNKGDIVKIVDNHGKAVGFGLSQYNSIDAQVLIGKKDEKPMIRYEYLFSVKV